MRGHPVANALRRHLLARDEIAFDEHALDRAVAITVVRVVADAQGRAVLEDHARRAFNLDREQIERIFEPADLEFLPVERAGFDLAAVVVRHEFVVRVAASDPHPFVRKCNGGGLVADGDQITRPAIDWDVKFGTGKARARNDRLEIAGQKSLPLAQARDANGAKILFKEGTSGIRILWPQSLGVAADVPQGSGDRSMMVGAPYLAGGSAACLIGRECREVIIGPPAREFGPFDRLELAACESQRLLGRFLGRCGAGCKTYDCAEQAYDHAAHRGMRKTTIGLQASNRIEDANAGPGGAS